MFRDVLDMLARLPESELREARRTRPPDMPAEIFEVLLAMARGGNLPPLPKIPTAPKPPAPPTGPQSGAPKSQSAPPKNPDQMDLF